MTAWVLTLETSDGCDATDADYATREDAVQALRGIADDNGWMVTDPYRDGVSARQTVNTDAGISLSVATKFIPNDYWHARGKIYSIADGFLFTEYSYSIRTATIDEEIF